MTHCDVWESSLILVHVAPCPGSTGIESGSTVRYAFRTAFADARCFLCHLHVFLCSCQSLVWHAYVTYVCTVPFVKSWLERTQCTQLNNYTHLVTVINCPASTASLAIHRKFRIWAVAQST
jgi:hypothetical protein